MTVNKINHKKSNTYAETVTKKNLKNLEMITND